MAKTVECPPHGMGTCSVLLSRAIRFTREGQWSRVVPPSARMAARPARSPDTVSQLQSRQAVQLAGRRGGVAEAIAGRCARSVRNSWPLAAGCPDPTGRHCLGR